MKSETPTAAGKRVRKGKATHLGSCQVCGAVQKLPEGVLAKHGYTTKWGCFDGVCTGSGYRPFEEAYDRIQLAVDHAKETVVACQKQIETLNGPITSNKAPFEDYDSTRLFGGYYETEVTVTLDEKGYIWLQDVYRQDRKHPGLRYSLHGSVEEVIRKLNGQRVQRIGKRVAELERYIVWQERRIREWKPGELQPVEAA